LLLLLFVGSCQAITSDTATGEDVALRSEPAAKSSPEFASNGPLSTETELKLALLKHTLVLVKTKYYDPSRVDWRNMMGHGLDALQSAMVEIVAEFDQPLDSKPSMVNLRVNTKSKLFDLTAIQELSDVHEMSVEVMSFVTQNLREDKPLNELEYLLINGMLSTLDPHSVLLTPKMYEDMRTSHGGFGGIGIVIGIRNEALTIISPIEGTPAWEAGLKASDQIVRIGEESTINMPLQEAVDRLRGEVGTTVNIDVTRKGWTEPRPFTIERRMIAIRSLVSHPLEEDKLAYIKIKSFEKNTGTDVLARLEEMKESMGRIDGLILDLRYNAGGLLNQAVEVADAFLEAGLPIVISEGINGSNREEEKARLKDELATYPIVVLINAGSASASEIVAGALRNHGRAVLLGERTFGKGSVQILRDNDDGSALKMTIAQYLTPGDISIQGVGIPPDIRVVPVFIGKDEEIDLMESDNVRREGTLELTLSSDKTRAPEEPRYSIKYLAPEDQDRAEGEQYYEDFEIRLARTLLLKTKSATRSGMLDESSSVLPKVIEEEDKKLATALSARGLDWRSLAQVQPQPFSFEASFVGPEGEPVESLVPGTEAILRARVTNNGSEAIAQLYAVIHANTPLFDDRELLFGYVAPGESREWDLKTKIPPGAEARTDRLEFVFSDASGARNDVEAESLATVAETARPQFALSYYIDDSQSGNGDGQLQLGESVSFVALVENRGPGDAVEVVVALKNESAEAVYLSKGRESLGKLEAGQTVPALMKFDVKSGKDGGSQLELMLTVYDAQFGAELSHKLLLPVEARADALNTASGAAVFSQNAELVSNPSANALKVAQAQAGDVVEREAVSADGSMVRVRWGSEEQVQRAWVASGLLTDASSAMPSSNLKLLTALAAPSISFDPAPLLVDAESYELSGLLRDDTQVSDYRVYLWHRDGLRIHAQKLDYGTGGRDEKRFVVNVPLRKGLSTVTLVARDEQKLENAASVNISRP
jgi:carboxyl-terminal processing protease